MAVVIDILAFRNKHNTCTMSVYINAYAPVSKVLAYKHYVSDNVHILYISLVMLVVYELNTSLHKVKNEHKSPTKTHGG